MLRDLWAKNQKECVIAVGMICFLIAGIVVAGFPAPERRQANARAETNRNAPPESRIVNEGTPIAAANDISGPGTGGTAASNVSEPEREWVLYITGAVRRPGVYSLPAESRLLQLVEAAGGLDISADPVAVNLAAFLQDGLHIHVPAKGEDLPARGSHSMPTGPTTVPAGASGSRSSAARGNLININRASAEELTALRGIGPVTAGNIVEHRNRNGRFHSVDDLLHVTGIGRVRLEQLRDFVTVGP